MNRDCGCAGLRVWDSRGNPTVEAVVVTERGAVGRAIAPAGASRGAREAVDLRDGGVRLGGKDVAQAVAAVNGEVADRLRGMEVADQAGVDAALEALDGTADRGRLGGNALVAVSLAVMQAAAAEAGVPVWRHLADRHGMEPTVSVAGDPDLWWWRPCGAARRRTGFHGHGTGGRVLCRGA